MLKEYIPWRPSGDSASIVNTAVNILEDYASQGLDLTLRQLYYQFVARGLIANKQTEYKRLGDLINKARLGGYVPWNRIVDRTRELRRVSSWEDPGAILSAVAEQYTRNLWEVQSDYVEVWIEKDALIGVIEGVCQELHVPYFSCRGFVSQSEMHSAALRFIRKEKAEGVDCHILHLGDHDPSGMDMTRDIQDRLSLFGAHVHVERIALNMDQILELNPPPNPAKTTDSRSTAYIREYGEESWELDAIEPRRMVDLIRDEIMQRVDAERMDGVQEVSAKEREFLAHLSNTWEDLLGDFEN